MGWDEVGQMVRGEIGKSGEGGYVDDTVWGGPC